jgi:hypothetical protein
MGEWVVHARVDAKFGEPTLVLIGDPPKDLRYKRQVDLFFAQKDGYVQFYLWDELNGNNRGYGGSKIPIILENGTEITLLGPWSSRCGVMNNAGFMMSMRAICNNHVCIHITVQLAMQLLERFNLSYVVQGYNDRGEIKYRLVKKE